MRPWDRNLETKETRRAHRAFMDYCRMGPKRSLRQLLARYREQREQDVGRKPYEPGTENPPTIYWNTLTDWSRRHHWQDRVAFWDAEQERIRTEEHQQKIREMSCRHAQLGMIGQTWLS